MFVVVSSEVVTAGSDFEQELALVEKLFVAGLSVFHLRKPDSSAAQHRAFLDRLHPEYHCRVMLHNWHELADEYAVRGFHYPERMRRQKTFEQFVQARSADFRLSSSFHSVEDIVTSGSRLAVFDYVFLGPMFDSISKKGYKGKGFDLRDRSFPETDIFAIGGIESDTISTVLTCGFDGLAFLGAIWNAPDPVKKFLEIKKCFALLLKEGET